MHIIYQSPIHWLSFIWNVVLCILANIFIAELRKIRRHVISTQETVPRVILPVRVQMHELMAPPVNISQCSDPPPPYLPPPTYADSLEMEKNYQAHNSGDYTNNSGTPIAIFTVKDCMVSAPTLTAKMNESERKH